MRLHVNDSSRTHNHRPPPVRRPPACLTPPTNGGIWLFAATTHSTGATGAFYTTNSAIANVRAALASFTMKFLGHGQDGSGSPEQTFRLEAGISVTCFDVLATVFSQSSTFGAIRITSDPSKLHLVSVTSTHGFGGTLSQSVPAVFTPDSIRAGATLAAKNYSVPPNGMTQVNRIVRAMECRVSSPAYSSRFPVRRSAPPSPASPSSSTTPPTISPRWKPDNAFR